MPELVKLFIRHYIGGFAVAAVFIAGFLWFDIAGVRSAALSAEGGGVALAAFSILMGLTFASLQCGIAVWVLSGRKDEPPKRGRRLREGPLEPVPVRPRQMR